MRQRDANSIDVVDPRSMQRHSRVILYARRLYVVDDNFCFLSRMRLPTCALAGYS
jgi:hypothetical protein